MTKQKILILLSINGQIGYALYTINEQPNDPDILEFRKQKPMGYSNALKIALSLGWKMQQIEKFNQHPGERCFLTKDFS